jgi:predicted DNA-binding protein (MmcQ/YjbR family)
MDIEKVRKSCLKKKGVTEGFPFGDDTLVFKVMNKMFCLLNLVPPCSLNLKCDPETAVELREKYSSVTPGYHMNKIHWNTVLLDSSIPDKEILSWIDNSYELIVKSLPLKEQTALKNR